MRLLRTAPGIFLSLLIMHCKLYLSWMLGWVGRSSLDTGPLSNLLSNSEEPPGLGVCAAVALIGLDITANPF